MAIQTRIKRDKLTAHTQHDGSQSYYVGLKKPHTKYILYASLYMKHKNRPNQSVEITSVVSGSEERLWGID